MDGLSLPGPHFQLLQWAPGPFSLGSRKASSEIEQFAAQLCSKVPTWLVRSGCSIRVGGSLLEKEKRRRVAQICGGNEILEKCSSDRSFLAAPLSLSRSDIYIFVGSLKGIHDPLTRISLAATFPQRLRETGTYQTAAQPACCLGS